MFIYRFLSFSLFSCWRPVVVVSGGGAPCRSVLQLLGAVILYFTKECGVCVTRVWGDFAFILFWWIFPRTSHHTSTRLQPLYLNLYFFTFIDVNVAGFNIN